MLFLTLLLFPLQKFDSIGLKSPDALLALRSPAVPVGRSRFQLISWNAAGLQVCLESIFVALELPATGASAVSELAVKSHFRNPFVIHADHMAGPS